MRRGETLQSIAEQEYDNAGEWRRIADANHVDDPFRIEPGTRLGVGGLIRAYGVDAARMLGGAKTAEDRGQSFGWNLTAREVDWLITHEFAQTAEDILWRRSKLGLRLSGEEVDALRSYVVERVRTALKV